MIIRLTGEDLLLEKKQSDFNANISKILQITVFKERVDKWVSSGLTPGVC